MRDPLERYFVYILLCRDRSYYTGVTNSVEARLMQHQEGMDPECYTYKRRPVEIVFQQGFREITDAIAVEKQIKGWSRKKKEALIRGEFDLLIELSKNSYARRIDYSMAALNRRYGVILSSTKNDTVG